VQTEASLRALTQDTQEKAERAQNLNAKYQGDVSRLRLMEEMSREMEGYNQSVRKALSFGQNDPAVRAQFAYDAYTIVGVGASPIYINHERGASTVGSGTVRAFLFVPRDGFADVKDTDLFLSLDTIRTNAELLGEDYGRELHRVIIHGIIHLIGFKDKTPTERREMEAAEDAALALFIPKIENNQR
jgi:rRNA maturation RNase YbeY